MTMIYNSALQELLTGQWDFGGLTQNGTGTSLRLMLVTSAYVANETARDTHTKRSDITNEVTGTGYTAGGQPFPTTPTLALDTANNRYTVTFPAVTWASSTITARGGVIYRNVGSAATDNLLTYVSFGASDIISSGGNFTVTFTAPLTFQL